MEELLKSLEQPLFGAKVTDPLVKQLADFVYLQCNLTNVEIEAKFGWCIDKATQQRISLPVLTDTVLSMPGDPAWYRFESNMSLEQHRHFNQAFNRLVTTPVIYLCIVLIFQSGAKMTYKHTREVDEFFNVQGRRIRVTRDKNTNEAPN
jgi:polynucleotide 5'-triphosphatase